MDITDGGNEEDTSSRRLMSTAIPPFPLIEVVVGADDVLNERMPDHIEFGEMDKTNPLGFAEEFFRFHETGYLVHRQVDLGHIPRNHGLGSVSESRQEHLHLFRCRILGFVKDDKGIVERPSPHEGERSDLDDPFVDQGRCPVKIDHIKEGVIKRTQIGIDLFREIARQETQLLTRFDGGSGQRNARDLFLQQCGNRHGHGQIGLSGSRRSDAEDHVRVPDGIDIEFLGDAFRGDDPFLRGDEDGIQKDPLQICRTIFGQDTMGVFDIGRINRISLPRDLIQLGEQFPDECNGDPVAGYGDDIPPDGQFDLREFLDELDILVMLAKESAKDIVIGENDFFQNVEFRLLF